MKPGELVVVDSKIGLGPRGMEQNGKAGLVIDVWTSGGVVGDYVDVLIEGIKMSFYKSELRLLEEAQSC